MPRTNNNIDEMAQVKKTILILLTQLPSVSSHNYPMFGWEHATFTISHFQTVSTPFFCVFSFEKAATIG